MTKIFALFALYVGLFPAYAAEAPKPCEKELQGLSASQFISDDRLRELVDYLTGEKPVFGDFQLNNRTGVENREVTRQVLLYHFRKMGLFPEIEAFPEGANVLIEFQGTESANQVLEIGAHFDSLETGADDNAAGVALLVHLAEILKSHPPKRTIRLVFHDLEEKNGEGAIYHAQKLAQDSRQLLGVLLVDAIGYYPANISHELLTLETGGRADNIPLASLLQEYLNQHTEEMSVSFEQNAVPGSMADHGSYWQNNRPALLISRPFGNLFQHPANHSRFDTARNMNWPYYLGAAKTIANMIFYVANRSGDEKPSWTGWPVSTLKNATVDKAAEKPRPTIVEDEERPDRHEGYIEGLKAAMRAATSEPPPKKKVALKAEFSYPSERLTDDANQADDYIRDLLKRHEEAFPNAIRYESLFYYTPLARLSSIQQRLISEFSKDPEWLKEWKNREPFLKTAEFRVTKESAAHITRSLDTWEWKHLKRKWAYAIQRYVDYRDTPEMALKHLAEGTDLVFRDRSRLLFSSSDEDYMKTLSAYILAAELLKEWKEGPVRGYLVDEILEIGVGALDYLKDPNAYEPLLKKLEEDPESENFLDRTDTWIEETIFSGQSSIRLMPDQKLIIKEVDPRIAILRGYVGNDCSTSFSPGFVLTPSDRYYYVFAPSGESLGYVGISKTKQRDKDVILVHTIQGPDLTAAQTEMILRGFAKLANSHFGAAAAVLGPDESIISNVNFYPIRDTMIRTAQGQASEPLTFSDQDYRETIASHDSTMTYDNPQKNNRGRKIVFTDSDIMEIDTSTETFSPKF